MKGFVPLFLVAILLSARAIDLSIRFPILRLWGLVEGAHDPFTIVVMPDTQCYCDIQLASSAARRGNGCLRRYLYDQVDWIVDISKKYPVEGNSGEEMWQKPVSQPPNVFMVLCGHSAGDGYLISEGVHGNPVHQVLCDYQNRNKGGESWLRYMTFSPSEDRIDVFTDNPSWDTFEATPNSRFK